jgi:hypothetical protein
MTFYRGVLRQRGESTHLQIVIATTDRRDSMEAYLNDEHVKPDALLQLARDALSIPAIPAVAIVGPNGVTQFSIVGALTQAEEQSVLKALFGDEP